MSDVHRARRARLAKRLDGPAWICAGSPLGRNYPANAYPFRASSHFLYFVGAPFEDASLLVEGDDHTLFVHAPTMDDALWHGPMPSLAELSARLGLRVVSLESMKVPADAATIPLVSPTGVREQEQALGRSLGNDADAQLIDAVIALRLRHDEPAIAELKRAAKATVAAHRAGMAATRPGVSEHSIRAAMEKVLMSMGMSTAYPSIVTVRGEVLHNRDYDGTAEPGDLLLADVGAETAGGWAGDVTRTWPVSGTFSSSQRDFYEVVLRSQRAAIEACGPGARYRDVHIEACEVLAEGLVALGVLRGDPAELVADGVHALLFPHGIGHLLGLDVHDMEDLGDRAGYAPGRERSTQFGLSYLRMDRDLRPGMAVTIEPGLYNVPGILNDPKLSELAGDRLNRKVLESYSDVRGIRIEDDVLIIEGGCQVLTAALPKKADKVEAMVGG